MSKNHQKSGNFPVDFLVSYFLENDFNLDIISKGRALLSSETSDNSKKKAHIEHLLQKDPLLVCPSVSTFRSPT